MFKRKKIFKEIESINQRLDRFNDVFDSFQNMFRENQELQSKIDSKNREIEGFTFHAERYFAKPDYDIDELNKSKKDKN